MRRAALPESGVAELPGFARASAIRSCIELMRVSGLVTTTIGSTAALLTGANP